MGSNARQSYRLRSLCLDPVPLLGLTFTFHFLSPWYHFKLFALQPLLSFHLLTLSLSCLSHPSTRLRFPWGQEQAPLVEVCVVAVGCHVLCWEAREAGGVQAGVHLRGPAVLRAACCR